MIELGGNIKLVGFKELDPGMLVVVKKIVADFSVNTATICVGNSVNFTDASLPLSSSRTWNFGDGTTSSSANPSHIYNTPGVYGVTLQATDVSGCSNTKAKNAFITVLSSPVVTFTANVTKGCSLPFNVNFTDGSAGAVAWSWNFGDGAGSTSTLKNPLHAYVSFGTYSVTLTITNASGCANTVIRNGFIIISPPVASFTATPLMGCVPLTVNFTGSSTSITEPIASYEWTLGNGATVTTLTPNLPYTYTVEGVYTVKLKIITVSGCKDSLTKIGYVKCGVKPVADFSVTPAVICFGLPLQFTDKTNIADEWHWTFGDGGSGTAKDPSYAYADTGTFDVQLIALNKGCPDTAVKVKLVTINPPKPDFIYRLSCTDYFVVTFTNTSSAATSVQWNFGDGTFSASNTPTHKYVSKGIKTVTITAFNSTTGCSFQKVQSFTIAQPIANFSSLPNPAKGCIPLGVVFTSTSQNANTYSWNLGNGVKSTNNPVATTYLNKGTYSVTLTITDINGCVNTKTVPNYVNAYAITVANFTVSPSKGCAPLNVVFTDISVADSILAQRIWNWGDGTSSTVSSSVTSHTFVLRGLYSITLTVQDINGCSGTTSKQNIINPTKPYPSFTVAAFKCQNDTIPFNASATSVTAPATYQWDFGDGTTVTNATPTTSHSYSADNTYTVTLRVTDVNGCDSTVKKSILILKPAALFTHTIISTGCGTLQVQFTDTSKGFVNAWQWDFGNGATSILQNPSYTYTSPGTYSVTLIVHNTGGCADTITKGGIIIVPGPIGTFSFSPATGCVPLIVTFHAASGNSNYYTWDFGDGNVITQSSSTMVQHTYLTVINVTPIVLLGNTLPNGSPCELPASNITGAVTVTSVLVVNVTPPSPIQIGEDDFISLTTATSGPVSTNLVYAWTPPEGLSCTDCPDPFVKTTEQDMRYYLTVSDMGGGGCIGWDTVDVVFVPCVPNLVIPNVFTPNYDDINDVFTVSGVCKKNEYEFIIYDRWGLEVFNTSKRHNGWDGRTTSGEPLPEGVYYYLVKVDGVLSKGFVQLFR